VLTPEQRRAAYEELVREGRRIGALLRKRLPPDDWDRADANARDAMMRYLLRVLCREWRLDLPAFEWVEFKDEDQRGSWEAGRVELATSLRAGDAIDAVVVLAHELRHAVQDLVIAGQREHALGEQGLAEWRQADKDYDPQHFLNPYGPLESDTGWMDEAVREGYSASDGSSGYLPRYLRRARARVRRATGR
jgi:hypothetical protein